MFVYFDNYEKVRAVTSPSASEQITYRKILTAMPHMMQRPEMFQQVQKYLFKLIENENAREVSWDSVSNKQPCVNTNSKQTKKRL